MNKNENKVYKNVWKAVNFLLKNLQQENYLLENKKNLKLTTSAFTMAGWGVAGGEDPEGQIKLKDSKRKEIINSELIPMKQKTKQRKIDDIKSSSFKKSIIQVNLQLD